MKRIYFDMAATTPLDPQVSEFMVSVMNSTYGNPSSIHRYGQEAHSTIERARMQVANALSCDTGEIIFTGCGTESNNMVLQGILNSGDHIISSEYEHPAVLKVLDNLAKNGVEFSLVKPNKHGVVNPNDVKNAIKPNTKLISIMAVQNELGTVNPIGAIGELALQHEILFHTDAVQMFGKLPIDLNDIHVDFLSVSAHKLYGPKGIGALYIKSGKSLESILFGGGQERNLRPGTENISGIAGFGLAAELANNNLTNNILQLQKLESHFIHNLKLQNIDFTRHGESHVPGVMNITFHGVNSQALVMNLDVAGIAISAGSACSSGTVKASKILLNLGYSEEIASESVRISIGKCHEKEDMDLLLNSLNSIIPRLKKKTAYV